MVLLPEEFLRRVKEEEPQTFEGGIAKKLLRFLENDFEFGDSEDVFEEYREVLMKEFDAVGELHKQFLREEKEACAEDEEFLVF